MDKLYQYAKYSPSSALSNNHEIFHTKIFYNPNISVLWSPPLKTGDDLIWSSFKTILICFHSPNHSKKRSFCAGLDALKGLEIKQSVIVVFFVATLIVQWIVISQLEFKLNPNPCSPLYIYNSNVSKECFQTQKAA